MGAGQPARLSRMSLHSTLSPSSAERWISCPASIRMSELVPPQKESAYATEGTAAHALAELTARHVILKMTTPAQYNKLVKAWVKEYDISDEAHAEMSEHANNYVVYLKDRLSAMPGSQLLLEQRLPTGVADSWGTSDAVMVSPVELEIVDFKYGLGIRVEAVGNSQLRLYAVGALEAYGDLLGEVEVVRYTVFQPRLGHVASEELLATDLRAWRDSLLPIAELALGPDAPFGPSEDACRWCPASGQCLAQMEWATARDFGLRSEVMSPEELSQALDQIPMIRGWCNAVEGYALNRVYSDGELVPGYKVVMSGGIRFVVDPEGAIDALRSLGFTDEQILNVKIKGIGDLEKLLKKSFNDAVGPYVKKSAGKPSLAPESDAREAVSPAGQAAADFAKGDS